MGLDQAPKQAVAKQLGVQEAPKGWFKFDDRLLNGLTGLLCTRSGIHLRRHLKLIQNPLIRHGSELVLTYPNPYSSFWAISSKGRELFFTLEERLREPTDLNIWGFVKPTFSGNGEIFIQHLGIPKEHEDVTQEDIGLRPQMTFNSKYYCEASPGLTQNARLESFFRAIRAFFTKHRNPIWVPKDLSPMGKFHEMLRPSVQQFEEVPRGARLCVFMDEPTIYLDPVNRLKFIQQLLKLIERFPGRLQFFIATNDELYAHLQSRAVYIDLYAQPPVSSTSLELAQYLK